MTKLFATAVTTAFFVFGSAFAQQPQQQPPQQRPTTSSSSGDEKSVSGCLMKGTQDNMFILTEKDTGNKWYVMSKSASVDLTKHVNHEVKLTGKETARSSFYSDLGSAGKSSPGHSAATPHPGQSSQSGQKPGQSSSSTSSSTSTTQSSTSTHSSTATGSEKYLQVNDVDHIAATCESR
jgi:hypothetical protein